MKSSIPPLVLLALACASCAGVDPARERTELPEWTPPRAPEPSWNSSELVYVPRTTTGSPLVLAGDQVGGPGVIPGVMNDDTLRGSARPAAPSIGTRLRTTRLASFELSDVDSLRVAVDQLSFLTGIDMVVTRQAEDAADGASFDLSLSGNLSARNVLSLIVERAGEDVGWIVRHGVVLVTTADKARGPLLMMKYDLRALTAGVPDFVGPDLNISPSGGLEREEGFGGVAEYVNRYDDDTIVALISDHVAPGSWGENGTSINAYSGMLFVRHEKDVQFQVVRLLAQL